MRAWKSLESGTTWRYVNRDHGNFSPTDRRYTLLGFRFTKTIGQNLGSVQTHGKCPCCHFTDPAVLPGSVLVKRKPRACIAYRLAKIPWSRFYVPARCPRLEAFQALIDTESDQSASPLSEWRRGKSSQPPKSRCSQYL